MRFNFYSQEIRGRRGFFAAARKVFMGSVLLGKAEWALVRLGKWRSCKIHMKDEGREAVGIFCGGGN